MGVSMSNYMGCQLLTCPHRFEIGEESKPAAGGGLFMASSQNPTFHCRDTAGAWEWRIRNLPYKQDVYSVSVEPETQSLVLRTSNKK